MHRHGYVPANACLCLNCTYFVNQNGLTVLMPNKERKKVGRKEGREERREGGKERGRILKGVKER